MSKRIWILSDGKAGHLSQTRGLSGALATQSGGSIHEITLAGKSFFSKLTAVWSAQRNVIANMPGNGMPDFIIAAGHGMHIPLLVCGLLFRRAKTVVCMKPSFPMRWFDYCIIPRHDLTSDVWANPPAYIIPTIGALHGVKPSPATPKTHTLVLIGGPSKEYAWDEQQVIEQLTTVVQSAGFRGSAFANTAMADRQGSGEGILQKFLLTTSRRTPAGFVDVLRRECPAIDVVPVEETPRGWVAEKLAGATAVWVTRDSVSMIYEALGSGAPVGVLKMSLLNGRAVSMSRVAKGIAMLEEEGWVTPFDMWKETGILKSKGALVEVDRVAECICMLSN